MDLQLRSAPSEIPTGTQGSYPILRLTVTESVPDLSSHADRMSWKFPGHLPSSRFDAGLKGMLSPKGLTKSLLRGPVIHIAQYSFTLVDRSRLYKVIRARYGTQTSSRMA
jgi:hypothetical protein